MELGWDQSNKNDLRKVWKVEADYLHTKKNELIIFFYPWKKMFGLQLDTIQVKTQPKINPSKCPFYSGCMKIGSQATLSAYLLLCTGCFKWGC